MGVRIVSLCIYRQRDRHEIRATISQLPELTAVFGLSTVVLLMDVALVTLYYALVFGLDQTSRLGAKLPSVRHASFWTLVILVGYLVWDIVITIINTFYETSISRAGFWEGGYVSVVTAVLAWIAFASVRNIRGHDADEAPSICAVDASLISLILLFRAMKQEVPLSQAGNPSHWVLPALFFVAFVGTLTFARYRNRRLE